MDSSKYKSPLKKHIHEKIPGWFGLDVAKIYKLAIDASKDGDIFIEIGAFLGKSTSFMAVEIARSEKDIQLHVVDPWSRVCQNDHTPYGTAKTKASSSESFAFESLEKVYFEFKKNLQDFDIKVIREPSHDAHRHFENNSVSFVFIDGCHCFDCVRKDIQNWLPKVKKNGVLAGHDFNVFQGVNDAVKKRFGKRFSTEGICWIYKKSEISFL